MRLPLNPQPSFEAELYASTLNHDEQTCIALTTRKLRCSLKIRAEALHEARAVVLAAQASQELLERAALTRQIILLRCCSRWHRKKLEVSQDNLSNLIQICHQDPIAYDAAQTPRLKTRPPTADHSSQNPPASHSYALRSRGAEGIAQNSNLPYFEPYSSSTKHSVRSTLQQDINIAGRTYAGYGEVYAISWPSQPGFIKIGKTVRSVNSRLREIQKCHPGATVVHSVSLTHPGRMERLLHLELEAQRRRGIHCPTCHNRHREWFEVSSHEVIKVMDAWRDVAQMDELYDLSGNFSPRWQQRIDRNFANITAQGLLQALLIERAVLAIITNSKWLSERKDFVHLSTSNHDNQIIRPAVKGREVLLQHLDRNPADSSFSTIRIAVAPAQTTNIAGRAKMQTQATPDSSRCKIEKTESVEVLVKQELAAT